MLDDHEKTETKLVETEKERNELKIESKELYCVIEQLKIENINLSQRITQLTQELHAQKVDIAETREEENVDLSKHQASMVRRHVRNVYYRAYKYCFFYFLKHEKYGVDACLTKLGAIDKFTKNNYIKVLKKYFTTKHFNIDTRVVFL